MRVQVPLRVQILRGVDQLVDRLVWDQEAVGSSPATPTKSRSGKYDYIILKMATLRVCGFESHSGYPDGGIGRRGKIFVLEIL